MTSALTLVPARPVQGGSPAGRRGEGDARGASRANLFLTATIDVGGMTSPVRVRDLSETGAQVEGPAFPQVGTSLILRRKDVQIGATVMWLAPPRCGLVFQGLISVPEWIAGTPGPTRFGQKPANESPPPARRARETPAGEDGAAAAADSRAQIDARVAEELAYVERLLTAAGGKLRSDRGVALHHPESLDAIDLAARIAGQLAAIVAAPDREAAIQASDMEALRARLLRKAIRELEP